MKIYKGWVSRRPAYWIVKDSEVKCIDCLVRDEYIIANSAMGVLTLEKCDYAEVSWLEVLAVTGITEEQMLRVFKEEPELRTSFAFPQVQKE